MSGAGIEAAFAAHVRTVLIRELTSLKAMLMAYPDEAGLWARPPGISNSAGTLALHLTGNLRFFVGAVLGGSGHVRDRAAEFGGSPVPRAELLAGIDQAIAEVGRALDHLSEAALGGDYPAPVGSCRLRTADFLLHLATHCAYHLGQVDYHRRIVTGEAVPVPAMQVGGLFSAVPV